MLIVVSWHRDVAVWRRVLSWSGVSCRGVGVGGVVLVVRCSVVVSQCYSQRCGAGVVMGWCGGALVVSCCCVRII